MKSDETFAENHDRMFINVQTFSQFENIILEQVDDILGETIRISFTSFNCWLQFQKKKPVINLIKISKICLKLSELAAQIALFIAHFKIRNKYVFQNDSWNGYHALFLASLIS